MCCARDGNTTPRSSITPRKLPPCRPFRWAKVLSITPRFSLRWLKQVFAVRLLTKCAHRLQMAGQSRPSTDMHEGFSSTWRACPGLQLPVSRTVCDTCAGTELSCAPVALLLRGSRFHSNEPCRQHLAWRTRV